jgi:hypothetical protein
MAPRPLPRTLGPRCLLMQQDTQSEERRPLQRLVSNVRRHEGPAGIAAEPSPRSTRQWDPRLSFINKLPTKGTTAGADQSTNAGLGDHQRQYGGFDNKSSAKITSRVMPPTASLSAVGPAGDGSGMVDTGAAPTGPLSAVVGAGVSYVPTGLLLSQLERPGTNRYFY